MPYDNLNIDNIHRRIHYTDELVKQLFSKYLGMNEKDPVGRIIWSDAEVLKNTQVNNTKPGVANQITWSDTEVLKNTQVNNTTNETANPTFTDEQVKSNFQGSQQLNSVNGKTTDEFVRSQFENSGVKENTFNYDKEKGTSIVERNIEYTNLLTRNIKKSGGQKLALFLGMYETLLMMNPRFNHIVNPAVVPAWVPPEGILPVTLDALFYDYSRSLLAIEQDGIVSSSSTGVMEAAKSGYNIGQIMGKDFSPATSPANKILDFIPNLFKKIVGDGNTNDPNVTTLEARLTKFNKLPPQEVPLMNAEQYSKMSTSSLGYSFTQKGDATVLAPNIPNKDRMVDNNQAEEHLLYYYGDPKNLFLDYGSKQAENSWLTFNIKPNAKTFKEGLLSNALDLSKPKILDKSFDQLFLSELSEFVIKEENVQTENTNETTGDSSKNSFSNISVWDQNKAREIIHKIKDDMQFPFFFEEVSDQNPTWCGFPATLKLQTDSFSPSFSDTTTFVGRPEQAALYSGTKRSIQLEFTLYVEHPSLLRVYKKRINWLVQRCYPKFYAPDEKVDVRSPQITIYKSPPLIRMTIGDIYFRLGGYIAGLTLNWNTVSELWEKQIKGNRIPLTCNVNFAFNVLHDFVPDGSSVFFDWDD